VHRREHTVNAVARLTRISLFHYDATNYCRGSVMASSPTQHENNAQPRRGFWRLRRTPVELIPPVPGEPYFCGRGPFLSLLFLALIGLFATGFLTYRHIVLASHTSMMGDSVLCRADGKINCDAVLQTDYSEILGYIPSAVLGAMGFVFVFWCSLNGLLNERVRKLAWVCLVVYFFAAIGFSWYYMYIMLFEVDFICTWCIVVHVVNLTSLVLILIVSIRRRREFLLQEVAQVGERIYFVLGGMLLSLLVFFACGVAEKTLSFQDAKMKYEEIANDPAVVMAMLKSSPTYNIPVTPSDPIYGPAAAPHALIFFSDFQCPVCARTELFLRQLVDTNPGMLKLVYKNYPLSTSCNHVLLGNLHPLACQAARAAYAAFLLGGPPAFWAYADQLFEHQKELKSDSWTKLAQKIGLDPAKFDELLKDGSPADKKIQEDLAVGHGLQLSATPQIVFKGKKIPDNLKGAYFVDTVEQLINEEQPDRQVKLRKPWMR
jgi:uncharacterized membrane protein/predicted DsbA family dithiol-disulfide isomerase